MEKMFEISMVYVFHYLYFTNKTIWKYRLIVSNLFIVSIATILNLDIVDQSLEIYLCKYKTWIQDTYLHVENLFASRKHEMLLLFLLFS